MAREYIHPPEITRRSKYLPAEGLGTKCRNFGTIFPNWENFRKKAKLSGIDRSVFVVRIIRTVGGMIDDNGLVYG